MKNFILIVIGLVFVGIAYLAIKGSELQEIETVIEISAPPSKIWPVLIDINNWQQWNPIVNDSNGVAAVGSALTITMTGKKAGKDGPEYNPTIIDLEQPHYFRWQAHMLAGFIFTNDKIIKLEETSTGTRLTHIETFRGLLAPIMCGQMEKGVPPMLNAMNQALKELVEQ